MKAIFPGSFDPVTNGHLDLVGRALSFLDELLVAVLYNPDKPGFFPVERRISLMEKAFQERGFDRVSVISYPGLLVDLARRESVSLIIRGVRNGTDLDSEMAMAQANASMLPGLETILLSADRATAGISSSLIRQIAVLGGPVGHFVPACVEQALHQYRN